MDEIAASKKPTAAVPPVAAETTASPTQEGVVEPLIDAAGADGADADEFVDPGDVADVPEPEQPPEPSGDNTIPSDTSDINENNSNSADGNTNSDADSKAGINGRAPENYAK